MVTVIKNYIQKKNAVLHWHVKSTICQICHGEVDHRDWRIGLPPPVHRFLPAMADDAAVLRWFDHTEEQDILRDVQIHGT